MHDFKLWPELTNSQMQVYYFESPHQQITEDFTATIEKVHDGDTVTVSCDFRDFVFPIRISNLAAPELNEENGRASQIWLESRLLGLEVDVVLSKQRVEKWGRLLADIRESGDLMSEAVVRAGHGVPWSERNNVPFMNLEKELAKHDSS